MHNSHDSSHVYWRPRLGLYANASKNARLFVENGADGKPDKTKPKEATSYKWWIFFCRIGDAFVFNDGNYSSQTSSHQTGVKAVLKACGVEYLTIHTNAHLGKSDEVLSELIEHCINAERQLAFTHSKRCKPNWQPLEDRQKDAAERLARCERELSGFAAALKASSLTLETMKKEVIARLDRELCRQRQDAKEKRIAQAGIEKERRRILAESWKPLSENLAAPITERQAYTVDEIGEIGQILNAFLTTDTQRLRIGNYFIDGNELVFRAAIVENKKVTLAENVIAKKFIEDGRLTVIGNASNLNLIGRRVVYGRVTERRSWQGETEIQKRLKAYVPLIPFAEFAAKHPQWSSRESYPAVPLTLQNIVLYRLTGCVPGRKKT